MLKKIQEKCRKNIENKVNEENSTSIVSVVWIKLRLQDPNFTHSFQAWLVFVIIRSHPLHTLSTTSVRKMLYDAVNHNANTERKLKLSRCIDPADCHTTEYCSRNVWKNSREFTKCRGICLLHRFCQSHGYDFQKILSGTNWKWAIWTLYSRL